MLRLVGIRSVSPSAAENDVVREVAHILGEDGLESAYTALGLDSIEGDPYGRVNAYAFLRGASPRTIVLLGHIDTRADRRLWRAGGLCLRPAGSP